MVARLINRLQNISLKNKIFFSITLVILMISIPIAIFTRWILISSLTTELKLRGMGIATSIAESGRSYLLTEDIPQLTSLIFEARLGERKLLISYVFVQDKREQIVAHTFTRPIPADLPGTNRLDSDQASNIQLLRIEGDAVYDISVPMREGIYRIGIVRVGLYKKHIDQLIGKLRTTFLGFVSAMVVFCFLVSHRLTRYITRPITQLTDISDELSRGNFDVHFDLGRRTETAGNGPAIQDEVHQLANSFMNMTRRIRESQAKLRESEQKYRSLFVGGPNPIFVVDRSTSTILDANPTAEEVYGYRRNELIGRPFDQLGPFDMAAVLKKIDGERELDTVPVSAKERYIKKGGTPFYVSVHACSLQYDEKPALIVATTDITEMVEKDNQLIQFSKLKTLGEMSAGIAHELNQPLNAIKMGSEFLEMLIEKKQTIPEGDLDVVVKEISHQVDRAADIIHRLRDFGRKSDFSRERISLNQPVKGVMQILGRQLALQNIRVDLDLAADPPIILAHTNRLEQVIFNLVTNARDALHQRAEVDPDPDSFIRIRTGREDGWAVVSVADNGVGIAEADRQRIFEAFYTSKSMGEGMGLGLSISYGIVEDYGGKIEVDSGEGKGTTFKLSFPLVD